MKKRSIAALLLLAVLALVVAGCGGGGSSSGSSSSATTGGAGEEESGSFAFGAEAACKAANQKIAALGTPQQSEVLKYLEGTEEVISELDQTVQGLAGAGSAESAYAGALGKSIPVLNQMANAARSENYDAVRELSDQLVELHLGELAEEAELKACAEVPAGEEEES
jgi:ABC-type Fe3+-hydroxamate transport system substrate-binding protein